MTGKAGLAQKEPIVKLTDKELEVLVNLLPKDLRVSKDQINKDSKETKRVGNLFFLVFNEPSIRNEFIEQIKNNNDLRLAKGFPQISSTNLEDIKWFKNGVKLDIAQLKEAADTSDSYLNSLVMAFEKKESAEVSVSSRTLEIQPSLQAESTAQAKVVVAAAEEAKNQTNSVNVAKGESAWKRFKDRFNAFLSNYSFSEAEANIDQTSRMALDSPERLRKFMQEQRVKIQLKMEEAKDAGREEERSKYDIKIMALDKRMAELEALVSKRAKSGEKGKISEKKPVAPKPEEGKKKEEVKYTQLNPKTLESVLGISEIWDDIVMPMERAERASGSGSVTFEGSSADKIKKVLKLELKENPSGFTFKIDKDLLSSSKYIKKIKNMPASIVSISVEVSQQDDRIELNARAPVR